jgi:hypothetical protein
MCPPLPVLMLHAGVRPYLMLLWPGLCLLALQVSDVSQCLRVAQVAATLFIPLQLLLLLEPVIKRVQAQV